MIRTAAAALSLGACLSVCLAAAQPVAAQDFLRFATFNASMARESAGALESALAVGDDPQILDVARIISTVDPDVLLINEFDYAPGRGAQFDEIYLEGAYPYRFIAPSNTGIASGRDLNQDGEIGETGFALANDAYGFGTFPGQYGMLILSKIPLGPARTFQGFLWRDMPGARRPMREDGTPFHDDATWAALRLPSKSHWAVPVDLGDAMIWVLAAHPTPPVFDGPEDRNGARNADEIRLLVDIARGAAYVYDDSGTPGGLPEDAFFVMMGDMNADPNDGDGRPGATDPLLDGALVNVSVVPESSGGVAAAGRGVNPQHMGNPAQDTADFRDDSPGNLRVDYVLPSATLEIVEAGVFWPAPGGEGSDWIAASDHRLVWVDVAIPGR